MRALSVLLTLRLASPLPNIVVVVADDLGFGGVSWAPAGDLLTPALDALRQESVLLSSYYAYKFCSPSRASLLTGRFPYKTESTRNNLIPYSQEEGVNLNFTFLPARLKAAGYATHGVGKWHQGLWQLPFTPTRRGFDSFRGFLAGGQDHFTQDSFGECGCSQKDMWGDGAVNATGENEYNAFRFTARAVEVIEAAAAAPAPLFLYVALQNVHAPIEADPSFSRKYPNVKYSLRRSWNAMVSTMDSSVGNITAALKRAGLRRCNFLVVIHPHAVAVVAVRLLSAATLQQVVQGRSAHPLLRDFVVEIGRSACLNVQSEVPQRSPRVVGNREVHALRAGKGRAHPRSECRPPVHVQGGRGGGLHFKGR